MEEDIITVEKILKKYDDNLSMLRRIKGYVDESIMLFDPDAKLKLITKNEELKNKSDILNKMLNSDCYSIIQEYKQSQEECVKSSVQQEFISVINIQTGYRLDIELITDDFNGIRKIYWFSAFIWLHPTYCPYNIIDVYDDVAGTYIFNTDDILVEKNMFASEDDLVKILNFIK